MWAEKYFPEDVRQWCEGRAWLWRALLLAYLLYAGLRQFADPEYSSLFSAITFGLHELGHVIFSPLGGFMGILGGSLTQLAAPLTTALLFWRQREYFGVSVAGAWLCFSFFNLAVYIGDARSMDLPLLGLTDDPLHDWNYLLGRMGLLAWDHSLARLAQFLGALVWAGSMLWGAGLLLVMRSLRSQRDNSG
jgi:hypothetical protein